MAKVIIVSDNHGDVGNLKEVIKCEKPFDLLIHCGDVQFDNEIIRLQEMAGVPVYAVKGNCDVFSELSRFVEFDYQGKHILVVHGYYEGVNMGIGELERKASVSEADIVFFGHTHVPFLHDNGSVIFANPGSIYLPRQSDRVPTYMTMDIEDGKKVKIAIKKCSK